MWKSPPADPQLESDDVHVWKASSDASHSAITRFINSLAPDERDRAARFHFERGRDNYVAARGVLRELLGMYLNIPPAGVQLTYTSHGKPDLAAAHGSDLRFNLAHSGDIVLIAFARAARIGIDVERCRPDFDGQRIADRFFTESESALLRAVRDADRVRAFTQQWTRKESFIKAHGEGLSYPLNAFSIAEDDNDRLRVLVHARPGETDAWCVRDLDVGDDYAAAITVELASPVLSTFDWCTTNQP
ncbi:MAG: 4'-phosphopantetheinyl transferase superfamily protein [Candidatus Hydrogenedentes bacterium]|nr:4'-phosphopantetheinyl transferase superfamily protein [Candidatus Hydrogenedentota bacterium]